MGKQPYIPIYIGDWEQDTNMISLEAEAALLKLVFKLWKSKDRGSLQIRFENIVTLFRKGAEMTTKILRELKENEVLNIEFLPDEQVKIESRRMLKDAHISKVNSQNGKNKKANFKRTNSEKRAKAKRPIENEYDNDIEVVIDYLNEKAAVEFKKTGKKNREQISARLKEKFTVQDFQDVIDHKVADWGPDEKMRQYLRPETLFGNKFEGYLNAARAAPIGKKDTVTSFLNAAIRQKEEIMKMHGKNDTTNS